jgi:hypothetical protein
MAKYTIVTTEPSTSALTLHCPSCDRWLQYLRSYVSGTARHPEYWDDYICTACGPFEYRRRTRKLRCVNETDRNAGRTQRR